MKKISTVVYMRHAVIWRKNARTREERRGDFEKIARDLRTVKCVFFPRITVCVRVCVRYVFACSCVWGQTAGRRSECPVFPGSSYFKSLRAIAGPRRRQSTYIRSRRPGGGGGGGERNKYMKIFYMYTY